VLCSADFHQTLYDWLKVPAINNDTGSTCLSGERSLNLEHMGYFRA
jgi:hypothetical protein